MKKATDHFASQLEFAAQTALEETWTAPLARSWIASCVPLDDARQIIQEVHILDKAVEKGEEGADMLIEQIR